MKRTKHVFHKSEKAITPQYQLDLSGLKASLERLGETLRDFQKIDAICRILFTPEEYHELFCSGEDIVID